jgi:hypothetical protein
MWTLTMATPSRRFDARIFLAAVVSSVSLYALMLPTPAQAGAFCTNSEGPCFNDSGSSSGSVKGVVDQRFNQIITNRVLGTVLLGVNEQVNCSDCVSAFGSAGSFSAGIHGRKEITSNLSLLAGIAYTQYGESGYKVTDAPIGAFALRYDFTDWGASRPFFDVGAILTPFEKVSYRRNYNYTADFGAPQSVSMLNSTNASDYGVYARAGWITRLSPRDEVAGSVEVWQLWQTVDGYTESQGSLDRFGAPANPFNANVAGGTDRTNLVKVGAQWTHLFGDSIETNINGGFVQSFANHSGLTATVTGEDNNVVVPTIGNQYWFEYGGRVGYRITKGWAADLFLNGTVGPQPVGTTLHGGLGLRVSY